MKATNEQLLERIKTLLEVPGVCVQSKQKAIIDNCKKLTFEQLCTVAASLRIRARWLTSIAASPGKMKEIESTRNNMKAFFEKYGIQL